MQLALDLAQDRGYSSGYPIEQYEHAKGYHYDLSYGVNLHKSHPLKGRYVGKKYYCYKNLTDIDMARKIVHIYDQDNRKATQKFYRLIDKASGPGLNDNTYDGLMRSPASMQLCRRRGMTSRHSSARPSERWDSAAGWNSAGPRLVVAFRHEFSDAE